VDVLSAKRVLETISGAPLAPKAHDANFFDIPAYLERAKQSLILELFKDTNARVQRTCEDAFRRDADLAWERLKNEILEAEDDELQGEQGDVTAQRTLVSFSSVWSFH
jgi:hypothetical protein